MSGEERFFGFLGRHGVRLDSGATHLVFGDLRDNVRGNLRKEAALNAALEGGDLVIQESPKPILYDETLDVAKVLQIDNAVLSGADPDWGAYSSSV